MITSGEPLDALRARVADALSGRCAATDGTPLVAACSGGADSVTLVAALAGLADRWPLHAVGFVDHGLREVGPERRAAHAAAQRAGVRFDVLKVQLDAGANVQAAARGARYAALARLAPERGLVATGHTATDQAETVLQRLLRGAGLRGLGAIRWRRGRVVRPMLGVSRAETRTLGLPFAEDPSNERDDFQRNRLRHTVFPLLAAENPQVESALARVADHVQDELDLVDALLDALEVEDAELTGADPALVEVLVRWRHRREHPTLPPPGRAAAAALARLLVQGNQRARTVSLGASLRGQTKAGRLAFRADVDPRFELVVPGPGTYRLDCIDIVVEDAPLSDIVAGHPHDHPTAWFDPAALRWPLTVRPARPDDEIDLAPAAEPTQVAGILAAAGLSAGTKKRQKRLVVLDSTARVLWIPQAARANIARPDSRHERVIRIRMIDDR